MSRFRAPPDARATFVSAKVAKTIAPGMTASPTSCRLDCPWCSPIARRHELGHPWRRTCAPCSRDRLCAAASCNGAVCALMTAIHGLVRSDAQHPASPCHARTTRAQRGPSDAASRRWISPKDGPQEVGQFAAGPWTGHRRTPGAASEPAAHGRAKGASAGSPSLWPLSLGHARESGTHAREAGGKKTRMSTRNPAEASETFAGSHQ